MLQDPICSCGASVDSNFHASRCGVGRNFLASNCGGGGGVVRNEAWSEDSAHVGAIGLALEPLAW